MKRLMYFTFLLFCVFVVPALSVKHSHNAVSMLLESSNTRRKADRNIFIRLWYEDEKEKEKRLLSKKLKTSTGLS